MQLSDLSRGADALITCSDMLARHDAWLERDRRRAWKAMVGKGYSSHTAPSHRRAQIGAKAAGGRCGETA
jgi:hypothetical protein